MYPPPSGSHLNEGSNVVGSYQSRQDNRNSIVQVVAYILAIIFLKKTAQPPVAYGFDYHIW